MFDKACNNTIKAVITVSILRVWYTYVQKLDRQLKKKKEN